MRKNNREKDKEFYFYATLRKNDGDDKKYPFKGKIKDNEIFFNNEDSSCVCEYHIKYEDIIEVSIDKFLDISVFDKDNKNTFRFNLLFVAHAFLKVNENTEVKINDFRGNNVFLIKRDKIGLTGKFIEYLDPDLKIKIGSSEEKIKIAEIEYIFPYI